MATQKVIVKKNLNDDDDYVAVIFQLSKYKTLKKFTEEHKKIVTSLAKSKRDYRCPSINHTAFRKLRVEFERYCIAKFTMQFLPKEVREDIYIKACSKVFYKPINPDTLYDELAKFVEEYAAIKNVEYDDGRTVVEIF